MGRVCREADALDLDLAERLVVDLADLVAVDLVACGFEVFLPALAFFVLERRAGESWGLCVAAKLWTGSKRAKRKAKYSDIFTALV